MNNSFVINIRCPKNYAEIQPSVFLSVISPPSIEFLALPSPNSPLFPFNPRVIRSRPGEATQMLIAR